jgi:hypothetical protein
MGIENNFGSIKITPEERKKAQDDLERLKAEGKNPEFYDDFSAESFDNGQSGEDDYLKEEYSKNNEKDDSENNIDRREALKIIGKTAGAIALGTLFSKFFINSDRKETEKIEDKITESQEKTDSQEQEEIKQEKEIKIENLADHYLKAYNEISKDPEKFPGDVFEIDLVLAQQCQESRGEIDAKSHSGALGVMQNMEISMVDVTSYLNKLEQKTDFEWDGPKKLSKKQIYQIKRLLVKKSDYSRAFGKIYLMQLWDNKYGYSAGREYYEKGDIKSTQIELMGAYNAGHSRVKDKTLDKWEKLRNKHKNIHTKSAQKKYRAYKEAIEYVNRIMNYKTRLGNIRTIMKEMGVRFNKNENYAAREIALILDKITGVQGEERKRILERETRKYLTLLKNINTEYNRAPTDAEIKKYVPVKRS